MPNWCNNRLTVSGDNSEQVAKVKSFFESDSPFAEIFPEPKWNQIPLAENDLVSLGRKRGEVGELPEYVEIKNPSGEVVHKGYEFKSTGCQDDRWYNWRVQNWDTKWDIHRDHVEWGDEDENYFVCHFDTAWSPPEGIIHKLRDMFPDLGISCFYDEPGMEFAGYV
jgi:hypothetical protein